MTDRLHVRVYFSLMKPERDLNEFRKVPENGAAFRIFRMTGAVLSEVDALFTNMPADSFLVKRAMLTKMAVVGFRRFIAI